MIIHSLFLGRTRCGLYGPPKDWPEDHCWDSDLALVNCRGCLANYHTFMISDDGKGITCLRCKKSSYDPKDVAQHYCVLCHVFHDDIWPPARHWWLTHPEQTPL